MNARFGNGGLITGGVSVGKTVTDNCEVLQQLPEMAGANTAALRTCRVDPPLGAGTQFKLSASYNLPWELRVSANYQDNPGIETTATYVATNAEIRPSLGRDLAAGARATANVELITPQSRFPRGAHHAAELRDQSGVPDGQRPRAAAVRAAQRDEFSGDPRHQSAIRPRLAAGPHSARARMVKFALQVDF